MNLFLDQLLAEATGETEPSVLRKIERILDEPQLEAYLGEPRRARAKNVAPIIF